MLRALPLVVVLAVTLPVMYPVAQACGDKFLMVGRGARFQRAYASVYPGKLVIYARPSTDLKAAIRDPELHKALRQAGHSVSVIEDWSLLEQALKTVAVDVVLVDVAEAAKLRGLMISSPGHPDALYVAFSSDTKISKPDVECRLKSSDRPLKFLDEVENTMKTRAKNAKSTKSS
jgi:hypothetical protein